MDPFYRDGFDVRSNKLTEEPRYLRSEFMKSSANVRKSELGQNGNDGKITDKKEDGYFENHECSSNLFDFCPGDLCVYYFYYSCPNLSLLNSKFVTILNQSIHYGASKSLVLQF